MRSSLPVPDELRRRYDVAVEEVRSAGFAWSLLVVRDTNRLLEEIDPALFAADERLPYWADLWSSAIALASHLRIRPGLTGAHVLELGCGTGLAGIAAAQAGAHVVLTDYEEDALRFALANADINLDVAARGRVTAKLLDWRTPGSAGTYDLVLGADIAYDRANFPLLLDLIRTTLDPGGVALVADPDRSIGREFIRLAEGSGFDVIRTPAEVARMGRTSSVVISELRKEGT